MVKNYGSYLRDRLEKLLIDPENLIKDQDFNFPLPHAPGRLIGTFEQGNNRRIPAIYVGQIPSNWSTSGLECIVGMLPIKAASYHKSNPDGYGMAEEKGLWGFTLRQFPLAQNDSNLVLPEQAEMMEATIELAHGRIMSWASDIQMQSQIDNTKTSSYLEARYAIPYDWTYRNPLGTAGPYV